MKNIDQMIAEQVTTWARREYVPGVTGTKIETCPTLTISREFGARGAALAALLGELTGFEVWDRDLLLTVAEESGADEKLLASLDERRRSAVDDAVRGALTGGQHTNTQYFRTLLRVVHALSAHGRCIIVGRGANYIGKPELTLRIRVVAPMRVRVRNYAGREGLSEAEARRTVVDRDAERADFVKHYFKRDIDEPSDYDVVVNSDTYPLDKLADVVMAAYDAKFN